MTSTPDFETIAAALVGGQPLAYRAYPDGSLVVIAPSGQKCSFSPGEVAAQASAMKEKDAPPASPGKTTAAKKPAARRGTPSKASGGGPNKPAS